jgi:ketosteroid isomerase-like protein
VVERVHKVVADPAERLERAVMRRVGQALGTTRTRGGAAAPSPIDVAAAVVDAATGAATSAMPESTTTAPASGDAARFIEALRAVEEGGDVERMVALFDDDAEISNPHDIAPHRGREGARRFWQAYRDSFEQIRSDFSKVVQGENTAMLEWTSTGRVVSGEPVTYSGVSVLETRDGRVHRFRAYFDTHDLETHGPRVD